MNGNYIITIFLCRSWSGLEKTVEVFLPGEGGRETLKVKQWVSNSGNCVQGFAIHCSVVIHISTFLCPIPSHSILFYLARKWKIIPKCFIPLVSVCLLIRLHSVTPFLKGLACLTWYILVLVFKSHIFSCQPQAPGEGESVSGASSAFLMWY